MKFKLVYGNHNDYVQLFDTLRLIKCSLESCGHEVDLEKNMTPGCVNILIDNFTYDFIEVMKEFKFISGTDFILVATEYVTGKTFNDFNRSSGEKDIGYSTLRHWEKRYKTFEKASEMAMAIWHLSESQVEPYKVGFEKEKVFYLPHGYLSSLESIKHKKDNYKDIDVIFTGSLTPYRENVLSNISNEGLNVKIMPISTPNFFRDDMVGRAKVAINIRQSDSWSFPSNSRFHYHLINQSFLVSETCSEECDLSTYVEDVEAQSLPEYCRYIVHEKKYTDKAVKNYERFKSAMPMKLLAQALIDSTLN